MSDQVTALSFLKNYGSVSNIHIGLNTSPLTDIWSGNYIKNKEGVWFLNGGTYPIMGLAGGNNTQKTGKAVFDVSRILFRFSRSIILYYDSESTLDIDRLARTVDELYDIDGYFYDNIENQRFFYMPASADVDGTTVHNRVKEIYQEMVSLRDSKNKDEVALYKSLTITTPFWSAKENKYIEIQSPIILINDSISETSFDKLAFKQFEEGDIDAGGKKRTRDMEIGNLRRVLMEDTCRLGPRVGICSYWIAQTNTKFSIDGKPVEKDSVFIRQGVKLAAPKAMLRLPHIGIELIKGSPVKHTDGTSLFPSKSAGTLTDTKSNPDLIEYITSTFRNKMGRSGAGISILGSQREGIQEVLSMYYVLRGANYYGLNGSAQNHSCALLPDINIKRTTVYDLVKENKKLARAIGICYHLWYVNSFWANVPEGFRIDPNDLYEKIKEQGHDWDEILSTIDFWHDNKEFINSSTFTLYELLEVAVNKKPVYWKEA